MKIFKIVTKKSLDKYKKIILNFYQPYFKGVNLKKALYNSTMISICIKDGKVIGAARVITDSIRYAMIHDMIVKKDERCQGIGFKLIKILIAELKKQKIFQIGLTYEKKFPWLKKFYQKAGFEKDKYCNYLIIRN